MTAAHMHDPRTVEVPEDLLTAARAALDADGPVRGAARLGISRNALLGICATGRCMPGTVALLRQKQVEP